MRKKSGLLVALFAAVALAVPTVTFAATNPSLSQVINDGTLSMDIVDGAGSPVATPTVAFPTKDFSFDCQDSVATLGTAAQKIFISNGLKQGVKLTMSAGTGVWSSGADTYKSNGTACTDGQLTVSGGTFNKTKGAGTPTVTLPGGAFSGSTDVTLLNTTSTMAWAGDITGLTLTQKVPAEQPGGTYSTTMTLSAINQ